MRLCIHKNTLTKYEILQLKNKMIFSAHKPNFFINVIIIYNIETYCIKTYLRHFI